MHSVNDGEALERLVGAAMEKLWRRVASALLPTGLSPHLQRRRLTKLFHVGPPLHTPYNPPYLPELMESVLPPFCHQPAFMDGNIR